MFVTNRSVGRLVEARVMELPNLDAVTAYSAAFVPLFRTPDERLVLCADHRPAVIYKPIVSDALVDLFRTLNTRWERAAIVVAPTNATLGLQLQRIVRESLNSSRRVFFEPIEAIEFLSGALEATERDRLARFLAEPSPPRRLMQRG